MLAHALRESLRTGYTRADLRADVLAGLVVGVIAMPLAMALGIASGVPPQHGLYTSIVAGAACALLGGSRLNVSGPTAAFVALLAPVSAKYGLGGLATATFMAGGILVVMGLARMGRLVQYIPHPVTTGFTAGIAIVIATLQLRDFFGLTVEGAPEHFWERVAQLVRAFPTLRGQDAGLGVLTLAALVMWPKLNRKVPAPLVAIPLASALGLLFDPTTIGTRFGGIPSRPPPFGLPWNLPGPDGAPLGLRWEILKDLVMPATTIALLGATESLLCAVVSDGMAGTRHEPNAELLGQGAGNLVAPLFGGIPATGAVARTAANVRAGARSPIAAATHAAFVLVAMLLLGRFLAYVPMASLAALLLKAAWNMSEARHVARIVKVAPRSDTAVLLTCLGLTVLFDMVVAVSVGVVLAALLFMRRMAEIAEARFVEPAEAPHVGPLPKGVLFYEIAGPLFFGAAEKAMSAMGRIPDDTRAVIFHLGDVPVLDATGLVALQSAIATLARRHKMVLVAGIQEQPWNLLRKAGLRVEGAHVQIDRSLDDALAFVRARFRD